MNDADEARYAIITLQEDAYANDIVIFAFNFLNCFTVGDALVLAEFSIGGFPT
ncbi:Uncharacterised protein [uncultured archaeon]|nr:Uncharacterised protein [uncultured archaeon]